MDRDIFDEVPTDYIEEYSSESIIRDKAYNDSNYDLLFHEALHDRFSEMDRAYSWIGPFHVFDWEIKALYKHYEYSHRNINRIMQEESKEIEEIIKSTNCPAELSDYYEEMLSIDTSFLLDINGEATLLMLYTLFENMLSSLAKYVQENEGGPKFIQKKGGPALIKQYFNYLRKDCKYDFYISKNNYDQLELMRIIRNYFVHDNKSTEYIDLEKYKRVRCKPIIEAEKVTITREYILSCFELTIELAKMIENAMAE